MAAKSSYYGYEYELTGGTTSSQSYLSAIQTVIEFIKPKVCSRPLIRIGGDGDGAYLLPDDLHGIVACFSPGVNNFKHFEDRLANEYGIKSHMCDYSSDETKLRTPLIPGLQTFSKLWLDLPGQANSIDLDSWVRQAEPDDPAGDMILQIDIEGAEFRNILACSDETLRRFRIIAIEVHGVARLLDPHLATNVLLPFFEKFSRSFDCVHAHPNNCCGESILPWNGMNLPSVMEFTFFRKDRQIKMLESRTEAPLVPHPLDIRRNVPTKAPIVLNEGWLYGPRPILSKLKILEDETAWVRDDFVMKTKQLENNIENKIETISKYLARLNRDGSDAAGQQARDLDVSQLKEVSKGCRYRLSSSYFPDRKEGKIRDERENFFFHTEFGNNQHITIDLATKRKIRALKISNRIDDCHDRARLLFVLFHNDASFDGADVQYIPSPEGFLNGKDLDVSIIVPGRVARYVTITSPLHTALHFSGLRIFAD